MEPSTPSQNTTGLSQNPQNTFGSEPEPEITPKHSRKKLFITIGIVLAVLIIAGTGLSIWAIVDRNNKLAQAARLEAAEQAKKEAEARARQGTVGELEIILSGEIKQTQELNDRSIFSQKDRLEQESNAATTIGTGNDSGI